jgi:hypothetical protein
VFGGFSIVAAIALVVLTAVSPAKAATTQALDRAAAEGTGPLGATIRRDQHGIPNIIGDDIAASTARACKRKQRR